MASIPPPSKEGTVQDNLIKCSTAYAATLVHFDQQTKCNQQFLVLHPVAGDSTVQCALFIEEGRSFLLHFD